MARIVVDVSSTVGSSIGWPVGWGVVPDTVCADGSPVEALVLMREPALPAPVHAWPVAVLHLSDTEPSDELLCVAEDPDFAGLVDVDDLPRWHAEPEAWAAALDRMAPTAHHRVADCGPRAEAERLLEEARHAYLEFTGCLD